MKIVLKAISWLFLVVAIVYVIQAFFNGISCLIFGFGYLFLRGRLEAQIEAMEKEDETWVR